MHPLVVIRGELFATATRLMNMAQEATDPDTCSQMSIAFEEVFDALESLDEYIIQNKLQPPVFV